MLGRPEEALASHDRALALDPNSAIVHNNRGTALGTLSRPAEALECHERALALDPKSATAHNNRGTALGLLNRFEEGLQSLDRAIALQPDLTQAYINRGNILADLKRYDAALGKLRPCHRARLRTPPTRILAKAWCSWCVDNSRRAGLFMSGASAGWRRRHFHAQGRPAWSGKENIAGKTLFIEAEQGLGDTIQFCRYAPMAADLGAQVILTVQASLVPLLESLDPRIEIVPGIPAAFDYHIPLLSLPLAFGTKVTNIPAADPLSPCRAGADRADARAHRRHGFQDRGFLARFLHRRRPFLFLCANWKGLRAGRACV